MEYYYDFPARVLDGGQTPLGNPFSKIVERRGGYSDWDWGVLWP
jgi:hypothetical protein